MALFVALGGSAYAIKKNSVGSKELAKNAVTSKKIKNGQVKAKDVHKKGLKADVLRDGRLSGAKLEDGAVGGGKVTDGSIGSGKIADGSVGDDKLSNIEVLGDSFIKAPVSASDNDAAVARAAAEAVPLYSSGPLEIYGKCFLDPDSGPQLYAEVFASSSAPGSLLQSWLAFLTGPNEGNFLNPDTPETSRYLEVVNTGPNNAFLQPTPATEHGFRMVAPDGSTIEGYPTTAAKQGTLPGGDGPYDPGDGCYFGGVMFG